ncbi:MAG: transporter substrate-binding domain-containing protein [Terrimicrobiaceae bacterium]
MTRYLLLILLAACAVGACTKKRAANELVVGMDLSYPPFETIDASGHPTGVSVDLARALGGHLGRPVRIENIPFTGLIPSLKTGKIDCVISSMTDTPERRTSISFSDPYLTIGLALLVAKDSPIRSIADVDQPGRSLAVRQGTTGEVWARANLKNAKIIALEKEASAVLEVVQGKADAFLYDQMSVWKNAREQAGSTRALLAPVQKENWAVGLKSDNEKLRGEINEFLKTYRASGGFERLGDKYLGEQKSAFREQGLPFYF